MKNRFSRFVPAALLIALILSLFPVMAGALGPTISISPSRITNDQVTTLVINGKGFVNGGTAVELVGYGPLSVTFRSGTRVRAEVPAGLAPGFYTITVTVGPDSATCANCLEITNPPPPTATLPYVRPQLVVKSSGTNGSISTNDEIKLNLELRNAGTAAAYSVQAAFTSTDLAPLNNGGVVAVGTVGAGSTVDVSQRFLVTAPTSSQLIVMVDVNVTYYDDQGASYSDKFTLTFESSGASSSGVVYPTATPTGVQSSQLVIPSYAVSIDPLQPGEQFTLTMTVQNMGNVKANRITMIVGGGSGGGNSGGTPQPGGVSGGSGEFTNFAPVGASNVQSLGDLQAGAMIQAKQDLIVNVSTNPGAYPMKVTFSYLNANNEVINDEQVITLLVYSLPNVDVSFYRPPDPFFVGQPGALPLQIVNIGKRSSVLGNMKITADSGSIDNGTGLVGSLDAGGYFTIDSFFTPEQSGTQALSVTIEYTDDFNQARTLTRSLEIEVMEGMIEEPVLDPSMEGGGGGGEFPVMTEETALQKVWRFILGLLGLDSAPPSGGEQMPPEFEESAPEFKPGAGKG